MLAGKIKLNTFLTIAGALGLTAMIAFFNCGDDEPEQEEWKEGLETSPKPVKRSVDKAPEPRPLAGMGPGSGPAPGPGPISDKPKTELPGGVDGFILARVGQSIGTTKIKDATTGRPYKVNLYQDDGNSALNRAKVDLDRDDKWDQKWTVDGEKVSRKVAPADDENYTVTEVWNGSEWVAE